MSQLNFLFFSTLTAIFIWIVSSSVKGVEPPKEFEARYAIHWHGLQAGESVHKLTRRNQYYFYETHSDPHLKFLPFRYVESTLFSWQNGKIYPQEYYYNIKEGKRSKTGRVKFDWKAKKLRNQNVKPVWEAELPDNIQDKLTQTFAARQALQAGATKFSYMVAEEDKMKMHTFSVVGHQPLMTKLGNLETLKIENISRKGYRTTLWLATKYNYLPVKMTQFRHGKLVASGVILSYHEGR